MMQDAGYRDAGCRIQGFRIQDAGQAEISNIDNQEN